MTGCGRSGHSLQLRLTRSRCAKNRERKDYAAQLQQLTGENTSQQSQQLQRLLADPISEKKSWVAVQLCVGKLGGCLICSLGIYYLDQVSV